MKLFMVGKSLKHARAYSNEAIKPKYWPDCVQA